MTSQFERDFFGDEPARDRSSIVPPTSGRDVSKWADRAFKDEIQALLSAPEGTRNDQLNVSGFSLGQIVGGGYLDEELTRISLRTIALQIGLTEHETDATLRSALSSGIAQPRHPDDLPLPPVLSVIDVHRANDEAAGEPAAKSIGEQYARVNWHELWAEEQREEWLVEPLIAARRLHALFSPPKVGKSLLLLDLAQSVARGVSFLGAPTRRLDADGPDCGRHVLYVDHENDLHGDIKPRLEAMGCRPELLDRLHYLSFPAMPFLDTAMGGAVLLAVAEFYQAELVVIDTISRAVSGEENDNDTWLGFYRNTGKALKAAGIACVRLDHTGKDESKGMRGGSAKYGDVDAAWSMTRQGARSGVDIFKLECTANRMPVDNKELVIERHAGGGGLLRHVLNANAISDSKRIERERHVTALTSIGFPLVPRAPNADGVGKAVEMCNEAYPDGPEFSDKTMRWALPEYRERAALGWQRD